MKIDDPLIDLRAFTSAALLTVNAGSIMVGVAFYTQQASFVQILELPSDTEAGPGLDMLGASLTVLPGAVEMVLVAPITGALIHRFGGRLVTSLGAALAFVGYILPIVLRTEVWHLTVASILVLTGIGLAYASLLTLIMTEVPSRTSGSANGVNALMRSIGTTSGATIAGTVLAANVETSNGAPASDDHGFIITFIIGAVAAVLAGSLAWLSRTGIFDVRRGRGTDLDWVHGQETKAPWRAGECRGRRGAPQGSRRGSGIGRAAPAESDGRGSRGCC